MVGCFGVVVITQEEFNYTDDEKRLISAKEILNKKYSYVDLEIDFESKYYGPNSSSPSYKGVFNYTRNGLSLSIPVRLTPMYFVSSNDIVCFDYVSMTSESSETPRASGRIYTGYNQDASSQHSKGEFDLSISYYDDNGKFTNIKLTN